MCGIITRGAKIVEERNRMLRHSFSFLNVTLRHEHIHCQAQAIDKTISAVKCNTNNASHRCLLLAERPWSFRRCCTFSFLFLFLFCFFAHSMKSTSIFYYISIKTDIGCRSIKIKTSKLKLLNLLMIQETRTIAHHEQQLLMC